MLSQECQHELRTYWLPHLSQKGLNRLIELLEQNSPLLIHGSFARTIPMGCLATHAGWNHTATCHLQSDAGIVWLGKVAGLNPAHSCIIREWDASCHSNWQIRADLLQELKEYREQSAVPSPVSAKAENFVACEV